MNAKFNNGVSVSKLWGYSERGELIAVFQYLIHAQDFARQAADNSGNFIVIACCHDSGKIWRYDSVEEV